MEKREYKKSGKYISLLGYGCMRLPVTAEGKIDYEAAEKLIDYAYDHGVNYFDTAYPYHGGDSENFVAYALAKYPRSSYFLADKMPGWEIHNMDDVERIFEEQLRRCRTEYFDFYLCHSLTKDGLAIYDKVDIIGYLARQKEQGRIRQLGFSFHDSPALLEQLVRRHPWDFAQLQLNYMDWQFQNAKRQYEILAESGLPCVVMEPVRGGALATLCAKSLEILNSADPKRSAASWAIRFAASLPNVMTVLSGMSNMEQVMDNVSTMTDFSPITPEEQKVIDRALAAYQESKTVPCTGCRYCMECPAGVDIPLMFRLFNAYHTTADREDYIRSLRATPESKYAKHCVGCRQCVSHCPQSIEIPEKLQEVSKVMDGLRL